MSNKMVLWMNLLPVAGARLVSESRASGAILTVTRLYRSNRHSPSSTPSSSSVWSQTFPRGHGAPLRPREARRRRANGGDSRRLQEYSTRIGGMVVGGMTLAAGGISAVIMAKV